MSSSRMPGRHELGQNFLTDRRVIRAIVDLAAGGQGRLVEWAGGNGAVTVPLSRLRRPVEVVELDPRRVRQLRARTPRHVTVTAGDILRHAPPREPWTLVANLPFHLTTPALRRMLALPGWDRAVLVTQWEVARKRAGVGGTTQLTAQWWPWFEFLLQQRIPSTAFKPRPSVDGGLLLIQRRTEPLLGDRHRGPYQGWVRRVFTGRGRGLPQILATAGGMPPRTVRAWCRDHGLQERTLPRALTAHQWVSAYEATVSRRGRPARPRTAGRAGPRR